MIELILSVGLLAVSVGLVFAARAIRLMHRRLVALVRRVGEIDGKVAYDD